MALIICPECGKEISDKAYFCPHCGNPMKDREMITYTLQTGSPTTSSYSTFLSFCGYLCWIGGALVSIVGAFALSRFSLSTFLTLSVPYLINGVFMMCLAHVVSQVNSIYNILYGLRLTSSSTNRKNAVSNSKPTYLFSPRTNSGEWKCRKCGHHNNPTDIYCKGCGSYK